MSSRKQKQAKLSKRRQATEEDSDGSVYDVTLESEDNDSLPDEQNALLLTKYKQKPWVSELLKYYEILGVEKTDAKSDGCTHKVKMRCVTCSNAPTPKDKIIIYKAASNFERHLKVIRKTSADVCQIKP